jgi:hypothetical protein
VPTFWREVLILSISRAEDTKSEVSPKHRQISNRQYSDSKQPLPWARTEICYGHRRRRNFCAFFHTLCLTLPYLLPYLLTYLLAYIVTYSGTYSTEQSPWETKRFSASQEISRIYGTWRFITAFTSARQLSLSWAKDSRSEADCLNVSQQDTILRWVVSTSPNPQLEEHPLSTVRDYSFNIFAATVHIGGRSSIFNMGTRHVVVTGTTYHGALHCQ